MFQGVDAAEMASAVTQRSAAGIVEAIADLITSGEIGPGERLPTVRAVAAALGMGSATVSEAWGRLAEAGMIETRGRAGSFVPMPKRGTAARFFRYSRNGEFRLDLSTGLPDPELLPPLAAVVDRIAELPSPSSYIAEPVVPALEEALRAALPFRPQAVTVVDGALDALDRLLALRVRLGDRVAVADPGFPPTYDLIEEHGGLPVPVDVDDEGIHPDSLARALAERPVALIVQPRAQNPTGISMSPRRASALAEVLDPHVGIWIIEDDHSGAISSSPLVSLGTMLADRTFHITSFSKSHGPDFRIAAVAGPANPIGALVDRRRLGPAWTSRYLQSLLAEMLADPECGRTVDRARTAYAQRRAKLVAALGEYGIETAGADGLNVWVPVSDEQAALVSLASRGIAVAPGRPFRLRPTFDHHIRVTTGSTNADLTEVVDVLAS